MSKSFYAIPLVIMYQMKIVTSFVIVLSFLISCSSVDKKPSFTLSGSIDDSIANSKKIILLTQTKEIQDTINLKTNRFKFEGTVKEPTNAALLINGKMLSFPLVNDEIEVTIINPQEKEYDLKYQESLINKNLQYYLNKESKDYLKKYKNLESKKVSSKNDSIRYEVMKSQDSLAISFLNRIIRMYKKSEDRAGLSIITNDLKGLIGTRNHPDRIEELYRIIPRKEKNGFYGKKIKAYLKRSRTIVIGKLIDFNFIDVKNRSYQISDFKGNYVLLEFWASWCGPCISQISELRKIASRKEKIQIISISIDEDIKEWKETVDALGMNWINIHYKQKGLDLRKRFFINGIPYNILLAKDGTIMRKNVSMKQLTSIIKK